MGGGLRGGAGGHGGMAAGGIVTSPTFALIGERGPEAVIPLGAGIGGDTFVFNIGGVIAERDLISKIREEFLRIKSRNTSTGF